jgi:hypothetical protein
MSSHVILDGASLDSLMESFPEMVDRIIQRVTVLCDVTAAQIDLFIEKWTQLGHSLG